MNHDLLNAMQTALDSNDLSSLQSLAIPQERQRCTHHHFRSALMLSAHQLKHLLKIPDLECEAVVLNLEDGVSAAMKPYALALTQIFLSEFSTCDKKLIVRVNALDEGGAQEIKALLPFQPDAIRVPKIKDENDVKRALALLDDETQLHLSIETKEAWLNLEHLAIDPRIGAYYLGILDLFADLGLSQSLITPDNPTLTYILGRFLTTSLASNVLPVSFVYQQHTNHDGFAEWLFLEKQMGFHAKGCISPTQAKMVHEYFGNTEHERERAQAIVKLFEAHQAEGITGFVHEEYGFIDEPIYKGALAVLGHSK